MTKTNSQFPLTIAAASVFAAYGSVAMADEIAELTKPTSSISVGLGAVSTDRQRLGMYDGLRESGAYYIFDADLIKRDDATGTWQTLTLRNLGLSNKEVRGEVSVQGNWGLTLEYDQIQSWAPYTVNTSQAGIGTSNQTAPGAAIAVGTGLNYQFGTEREKIGAGFYKNISSNLDVRLSASTEDKTGTRITSLASSVFLADLIDWTTNKIDGSINYAGEALQLSGGVSVSQFRNNNSDGFVRHTNTAVPNVLTQPLDNNALQIYLNGGYDITKSTRGTFKVSFAHATQDAPLPTAAISNANYGNLPSLNGAVDTTLAQATITSKPLPRLNVLGSLRYHQYYDDTTRYLSLPNTTGAGAPVNINTTPYSYENSSGKVEGTYDLTNGYALTGGLDVTSHRRTAYIDYAAYVPVRRKVEETTYRVQLRKSLGEELNGSLAYLYGSRTGEGYTDSLGGGAGPAGVGRISPLNSANRERHRVRATLDWVASDRLDAQFVIEGSTDNYGNNSRFHGLDQGSASLFSLDLAYRMTDDWQLSGWYSYNNNAATFRNISASVTNDIMREQTDIGESFGFTLTGKVSSKTKLGAEVSITRDMTHFEQANSNGTAVTAVAPDIESRATRLKLFASQEIKKNAELRLDFVREQWSSNDWQWSYQNGGVWRNNADGTSVVGLPKQDAKLVSLRYSYRFQ